jgi:hypothetical protein
MLLIEFLLEIILYPVFEALFSFIGYYTGKPLVRCLSFGHLHVDPWLAEPPKSQNCWSVSYRRGNRIYLDVNLVALVGVSFWVGAIVLLVVLMQ